MIIPIYISTNSVRGFSFLHIFTNNYVLFDDSHSDLCAVVPNCSFDSHFSNNYNDEPLFMCLLALCMSLETCLFKTSALKKNFFLLSYMSCLYILNINSLLVISFAKIFLSFHRLSFCFIDDFLCCAKVLNLIKSHLFILYFALED